MISGLLSVAHILELRLKEPMQQRIDTQQSIAVQRNSIPLNLGHAFFNQRRKLRGEFLADVFAEFPAEISGVNLPRLELENHFANQLLMIGDRQRAVKRKLA